MPQVFATHLDAGLTWDFVAWLREVTDLPILVKVGPPHRNVTSAISFATAIVDHILS